MYQQKDIHTVLIAGSGVMGASFAQIFARHNYQVILYDIVDTALEKAKHTAAPIRHSAAYSAMGA